MKILPLEEESKLINFLIRNIDFNEVEYCKSICKDDDCSFFKCKYFAKQNKGQCFNYEIFDYYRQNNIQYKIINVINSNNDKDIKWKLLQIENEENDGREIFEISFEKLKFFKNIKNL